MIGIWHTRSYLTSFTRLFIAKLDFYVELQIFKFQNPTFQRVIILFISAAVVLQFLLRSARTRSHFCLHAIARATEWLEYGLGAENAVLG